MDNNKIICRHCFISGRVQGVSFRYYTCQQAQRLGVSGWVRNLADGRVEVFVCGTLDTVNQLCAWLHEGPSLAYVMDVQCQTVTKTDYPTRFEIS